MERELERLKERGPEPTEYDRILKLWIDKAKQRERGKVLIKGEEVPWRQTRHGYDKLYVSAFDWDQVAAPGWMVARTNLQYISRGKHTHRGGGRLLFCLEGQGYTIANDMRLDWQKGDLEVLPVTRFENVHQHFNTNPGEPCGKLVLFPPWSFMEATAQEARQMTDSSAWQGARREELYRPEDFVTPAAHLEGYDIEVSDPPATLLDDLFLRRNRWRERMKRAPWVIRQQDARWERNRMGIYRWYLHPALEDSACNIFLFWVHEIPPGSRSGKQKHQGGRIHFVIEGEGYTIVDGQRFEWKAEDLLMLPIRAGGVVFQHFNSSPSRPAKLAVAEFNWYDLGGVDLACGFEQIEDSADYP